MTKAQLTALAEELGIEGISTTMLKADIVSAILNNQGGG
ncbi:MAG: Rho termination factor N-terminal domain-containing protein [Clostridia bacterium]|nr:Rho termination factor N-terminal domain-containing protein [Clostridia bacterium]